MKSKIQTILEQADKKKYSIKSSNTRGQSYIKSYPFLLIFFKNFNTKSKKEKEELLIQGAHMIYGWMPTILDLIKKETELEKVLKSIETLGNGEVKKKDKDLEAVSSFMNNSLVGASKLLHFIYPEIYPIWDSKIYKQLNEDKEAYHYRVNNPKTYINYCESIDNVNKENRILIEKLRDNLVKEFEYKEISVIRCIEFLIFNHN
tara:strand:- start:8 stop:619 length:612 start_codon:yes stop_codon:yes gene_type:complete